MPKSKRIFYGWWVVAASVVLLFLAAGAGFFSFSVLLFVDLQEYNKIKDNRNQQKSTNLNVQHKNIQVI